MKKIIGIVLLFYTKKIVCNKKIVYNKKKFKLRNEINVAMISIKYIEKTKFKGGELYE